MLITILSQELLISSSRLFSHLTANIYIYKKGYVARYYKKGRLADIDILYNEYNDNNKYAIKIISITIVFLDFFIYISLQKQGLFPKTEFNPNGGTP